MFHQREVHMHRIVVGLVALGLAACGRTVSVVERQDVAYKPLAAERVVLPELSTQPQRLAAPARAFLREAETPRFVDVGAIAEANAEALGLSAPARGKRNALAATPAARIGPTHGFPGTERPSLPSTPRMIPLDALD